LFAKEGPAFVEYLKRKLAAARDDLEVRDIVLVPAEISRLKAYDVAGDRELMQAVTEAVDRVKGSRPKRTCEEALLTFLKQRAVAHCRLQSNVPSA
jgi:hypothetical protein